MQIAFFHVSKHFFFVESTLLKKRENREEETKLHPTATKHFFKAATKIHPTAKILQSCKFMAMEETPQHFFKVILASTLEEKKLRIPEKFVRKFRDELSAFATITTHNGRVWRIGLSKDEGMLWFDDGWHDFMEYYSIRVGYFLVFEYEKRSNFHVMIFDTSTFEVSYPYNFEEPKKEENLIHHDEIEKDEDYRNQKGSANLESSRPRHEREMPSKNCNMKELVQVKNCKMKELVQVKTDTADNGEDEHLTQISDLLKLKTLLEDKRIFISRNYTFSSTKERDILFTLARSLKPRNPSFMIVLWESHLNSHTVYLPAKFTNKYLTRDAERIKIQASNGREWLVRIGWNNGGCNALRGWTNFLNDMKLKVGDICVFELIRTEDLLLEVSMFRSPEK